MQVFTFFLDKVRGMGYFGPELLIQAFLGDRNVVEHTFVLQCKIIDTKFTVCVIRIIMNLPIQCDLEYFASQNRKRAV